MVWIPNLSVRRFFWQEEEEDLKQLRERWGRRRIKRGKNEYENPYKLEYGNLKYYNLIGQLEES